MGSCQAGTLHNAYIDDTRICGQRLYAVCIGFLSGCPPGNYLQNSLGSCYTLNPKPLDNASSTTSSTLTARNDRFVVSLGEQLLFCKLGPRHEFRVSGFGVLGSEFDVWYLWVQGFGFEV